jgi:hypothetical protein
MGVQRAGCALANFWEIVTQRVTQRIAVVAVFMAQLF